MYFLLWKISNRTYFFSLCWYSILRKVPPCRCAVFFTRNTSVSNRQVSHASCDRLGVFFIGGIQNLHFTNKEELHQ